MKNISFTALTFGCFLSACTCSATVDQSIQMSEDRPVTQDDPTREEVIMHSETGLPKQ
ncbi:hypothetical protein BH20ACI2_BH20ACI2_01190 [soil metagenome]